MGAVRRKFGKILFILLLTLGFGIGMVNLSVRVFTIESIEVHGQNVQVLVDQKRISKNLLFFPSETIRRQVLSDNPWLSDVKFQKKIPHTLIIIPTIRRPAALVISSERRVLIDSSAMVLVDGDMGFQFPHIEIQLPPFKVGETLSDPRIQNALTLIESLQDPMRITKITDVDGSYFLVKTDKVNIYITHDNPVSESIATLQTLLAGFRIKGKLPTVVDLRFDKPVVKF